MKLFSHIRFSDCLSTGTTLPIYATSFSVGVVGIFFGVWMSLWAFLFGGMMTTHASIPSSLGNHISTILSPSADPEMKRINAKLVITRGAIMKNTEAVGYFTIKNLPSSSMGTFGRISEFTISRITDWALPNPTGIAKSEVLKEASFIHSDDCNIKSGVMV